jgi:hypothetical protein
MYCHLLLQLAANCFSFGGTTLIPSAIADDELQPGGVLHDLPL